MVWDKVPQMQEVQGPLWEILPYSLGPWLTLNAALVACFSSMDHRNHSFSPTPSLLTPSSASSPGTPPWSWTPTSGSIKHEVLRARQCYLLNWCCCTPDALPKRTGTSSNADGYRKMPHSPHPEDTGLLANPCGAFVAYVPACFAAKSNWRMTNLGSAHPSFLRSECAALTVLHHPVERLSVREQAIHFKQSSADKRIQVLLWGQQHFFVKQGQSCHHTRQPKANFLPARWFDFNLGRGSSAISLPLCDILTMSTLLNKQ